MTTTVTPAQNTTPKALWKRNGIKGETNAIWDDREYMRYPVGLADTFMSYRQLEAKSLFPGCPK